MENKFKCLLTIGLLFLSIVVNSQTSTLNSRRDTIIVYDTIAVFDTVYVYDTIKVAENLKINAINSKKIKFSTLQLDTVNNKAFLLLISENQTATIPLNNIMFNENIKNLESMKNLSFLSVVMFAFQTMVMAQSNFGISAGGGLWGVECSYPNREIKYSQTFNMGAHYQMPFSKYVKLKTGLVYHYLINNKGYDLEMENYILSDKEYYSKPVFFGQDAAESNYHQLSIPLQVGFHLWRIGLYVGGEYSYRIPSSKSVDKVSLWGTLTGLNFQVSEKITLGLECYIGLTNDLECNGTFDDPRPFLDEKFGDYSEHWKSYRFGVTLQYNFKRKEKNGKAPNK